MPDVLSGLIWVQILCKGNQQTTLVSKEFMTTIRREIVNKGYTLNLQSIKHLPAKAISLINFVNSRRHVQVKMLGIIWIHTV